MGSLLTRFNPGSMPLKTESRNSLLSMLKKNGFVYGILFIIMAYYLIFSYAPIIMGIIISLKDMKIGNTILNAKWVGLENYVKIVTDPQMARLLYNTLYLSILRLFWGFWPPIVLAIFIFDIISKKFKRICQTIVYVPYFFSWVIIYGVVFAFFSGTGFINHFITLLGFNRIEFLMGAEYFRSLIVGSQIWKGIGWGTILYFAALTNVNPELYEACKIDGAGPVRRIFAVTLPEIMPIIVFSLIISLGNILQNDFEQIIMFYNPAVYSVADIIDTWVYRVGLGTMQFSLGAAVGILKAVIGLILILIANNFSRKASGRGIW